MGAGGVILSNPFEWQAHFFTRTGKPRTPNDRIFAWGAGLYNVSKKPGEALDGSGMASAKGPTKGYANAAYVGVVSIFKKDKGDTMPKIKASIKANFEKLRKLRMEGKTIVFPLAAGCTPDRTGAPTSIHDVILHHGLGKGVAVERLQSADDVAQWGEIQTHIAQGILRLMRP